MINNKGSNDSDHIRINSSDLQKRFNSVYKNFYNSHDIILSGNSILTWWADISHGVTDLRIKQKLPVKNFCGAQVNNSWRITFNLLYHYSTREDTFEIDPIENFLKNEIERVSPFLESYLTLHGFEYGLEIDFLSEMPPWHGLSFSGVMSVLLAYLLCLVTNKINVESLTDNKLLEINPAFNEIYILSLEISNRISNGKSIGASNYAVMVNENSLPIVHFSKKNLQQNSVEEENDNIEHNTIYKGKIVDFLWISQDSLALDELPIDYWIIFAWLGYRFFEIEATREQKRNDEKLLSSFIIERINSLSLSESDKNLLSNILSCSGDEVIYKNIDNMNLRILESFGNLLKNPGIDSSVDLFINAFKQIGLSSFSYQKENKLFFSLQCLFNKYLQFEDESIWIFPLNSGKIWGSLFFVMKKWKSRTTLNKVLSQLKDDGYSLSLDYASWRDGYASGWVCIDQYITKKLYSSYTKEWDIQFSDTFWNSYCDNYGTIIENQTDCILLDTIGWRIYIKWIKLTSKDIHSQNTTIDMLRILMEHIWTEVSNNKLPVSTYSQNKNEILGKIIIPLKKIVKDYFSTDISLSCSGGITDYYLKLDKDEAIRIGIIKKLSN